MNKFKSLMSLVLLCLSCAIIPNVYATGFSIKVVPTLMDSAMDGLYKTLPGNGAPVIHVLDKVYHNQVFSVLVAFNQYTLAKNNKVDLSFDYAIYDSQGKLTQYTEQGLLGYKGKIVDNRILLLNQEALQLYFTDGYQLGRYKIKVIAQDNISGQTVEAETTIELTSYSSQDDLNTMEEAAEWMMAYHTSFDPIKGISAALKTISTEDKWIESNMQVLAFFRRIFIDNPFLFRIIANGFESYTFEQKKIFVLISAIAKDEELQEYKADQKLIDFYKKALVIDIPNINGTINSAVQLDVLWAEFLATGKYKPIKDIVNSLKLKKYRGALHKVETTNPLYITKRMEQEAKYEAVYSSVVWSLVTNCQKIPLVYKYCIYIHQQEKLQPYIKNHLATILNEVYNKLQQR